MPQLGHFGNNTAICQKQYAAIGPPAGCNSARRRQDGMRAGHYVMHYPLPCH
ncbi:hypothetical protein ACFOEY_03910 [Paracandidimonas soli]|uniref:hypothetical protein n=1 Tax=Paracandidimonas soli TaxID=1917182 RepID=UPI003611B051